MSGVGWGRGVCFRPAEFESALVPKIAIAFGGIEFEFEFAWVGLGSHGAMSLFEGAMLGARRGQSR